nr:DUF6508 domain-containing protein [Paeniglutamicibacter kerguelensis]
MLDAGYETPIRGGSAREDGLLTLGCPDYDYLAHIERIERRPIARAALEELSAWFTWLRRGERFCDGRIAESLESGRVRELITRLLELSPAH